MGKLRISKTFRLWLYGVAIAFIPLAVYLGWMDAQAAALAIPLVVAILYLKPSDVPTYGHPQLRE